MSSPILFGLGNPLLDIQVNIDTEYLKKYDLKANDAILAEEKHQPIYDEITSGKHEVTYVCGGAAQNAIRGAQYVLPPNSTVYVGCVGEDKYSEQLRAGNEREGVRSEYMVDKSTETGKCAVLLTENNRSLVTDLKAANNYRETHLKSEPIWKLVEGAKYFYVGGFHLTVCVDAILALGKHAAETNKTFAINTSAPFIPQFFKSQLDSVLPYTDYVIGNEDEMRSYSEAHELNTTDVKVIAKKIADLPKENKSRPRIVVITQGPEATHVAKSDTDEIKTYPVKKAENIVDTNGAGDAFAGGFLGLLAQDASLDKCVEAGHWLAAHKLTQVGPAYPFDPKQKFE